MPKQYRQEYSIKQVPTDEARLLENTLNAMSQQGWELYSIYEAEQNSKIVYNCIFVREVDNEEVQDDLTAFRSTVEKMLYTKEEPYELCLNLQQKIRDKKEKIERVKKFLENSKEDEREILNDEIKKDYDELNDLKRDLREVLAPNKMSELLGEDKLSISLSKENYSLCNPKEVKNLLSQIVKVRQELTNQLGYIIPKVQFIENTSLDEFDFAINIHGVCVASSKVYPNHLAFFEDELNIQRVPKNSFKMTDDLTKRKIIWIEKEQCQNYWAQGIEPTEYIANYLSYYAIKHVDEIFDYNDLNRYVEYVANENPYLTDTIIGEYVSISELKYLLCQLIRQRISIKDISYIFEKLNDFSDDPNKADLLEKIRLSLSRQISQSVANDDKEIFAYELSDETLSILTKQTDADDDDRNIKIDLSKFSKFKKALKEIKKEIIAQNAILVVPSEFRQVVFVIVSQLFMDMPVLSYEEIALDYKLTILDKV